MLHMREEGLRISGGAVELCCCSHCAWIGCNHADGGVPADVFFTGWEGGGLGHSGPVMPSNSAGGVVF